MQTAISLFEKARTAIDRQLRNRDPAPSESAIQNQLALLEAAIEKVEVALGDCLEIEFVTIPAGEFQMGSPESESGRGADEYLHEVRITRPFFMASHELTIRQFATFVAATAYVTEAERDAKGGFGFNVAQVPINWPSYSAPSSAA